MSHQNLNPDAMSMQVSDSQASYLPNDGMRMPNQALSSYTNIAIDVANQQSLYQCSHNKSKLGGDNHQHI